MKYKSYEETSKILVNIEDKRDYVIKSDTISDYMLIRTIRLLDKALNQIGLIYDDIIINKGVNNEAVNDRIELLIDMLKEI